MKFLVDAQLPTQLVKLLQLAGYDTIHTRDLPLQNATTDVEINTISIQQEAKLLKLSLCIQDKGFVSSDAYGSKRCLWRQATQR